MKIYSISILRLVMPTLATVYLNSMKVNGPLRVLCKGFITGIMLDAPDQVIKVSFKQPTCLHSMKLLEQSIHLWYTLYGTTCTHCRVRQVLTVG